jgi:hypothetical protein
MKSIVTVNNKKEPNFHTTSNNVTKTNETGGIINDFNEVE